MKKIKISFTRLICIFIFIYIISNIFTFLIKKNEQTLVLKNQVIKESFKKKGLIIRDEYLIQSNMDGNIKYKSKDGGKIKKGDKIVYIYNKNVDEKMISKLKKLKQDISDIESGNTNIVKTDIKNINDEVNKLSLNLQNDILEGEININRDLSKLDELLKDKNKIIHSDFNSKSLKIKEEEENKVSNLINDNSTLFRAKNSGIVSYKYDNNENKFNIKTINKINKKDIQNTKNNYIDINKKEKIKRGDYVARVINNLKQYVLISCSSEEAKKFKIGQNIILSYENKNINSNVYDKYKDGKGYIVILDISEENMEIYDTRVKEFDIIYKSIEGLKVPKDALIELNRKKGVYVISETGEEKFVELQGTYYENEEYIVIDYYKNHINGIKSINIYDEIILNPRGKKIYKSR